jgi:hypothetical protein
VLNGTIYLASGTQIMSVNPVTGARSLVWWNSGRIEHRSG